jgi:hypothetical protein
MPTAKATFHPLLKDAQDYGSFGRDEKHMVSIIPFTLAVQGQVYPGMTLEVRQPYLAVLSSGAVYLEEMVKPPDAW